jgi:ABC-type Fe3+ transport system substrate-binding protein
MTLESHQESRIGRRSVLLAGAAGAAAATVSAATAGTARAATGGAPAGSLASLYQAARAEGGRLTVYAGGDTPTQQAPIADAFEAEFPGIKLHMVVDLSKVHSARFDLQLAARKVIPDVVELQALDSFPRWKAEGALLRYQPLGYDQVYPQFKDPGGYWTGVVLLAFANVTATSLGTSAPVEATDFLRPEFKDKLVLTFPNDDDAVLFFFRQLVDAYGWEYLHRLIAQKPRFIRGTAASAAAVYDGEAAASFATFAGLQAAPGATAKFTLPARSPFVSWAQRAAIPAAAPHPAAARLYLSWLLSVPAQSSGQTFSVRRDVPGPHGYKKTIFDYRNTDPTAFPRFLGDRSKVDQFRAEIQLYAGDVTGPSPTGILGFYPGAF